VSAEVAILVYLPRYPVVILGAGGLKFLFLLSMSSSEILTFSFLFGISISMTSPGFSSPIGPPATASGLTCPMHAPLVPPENLPSVIRATESPSPAPIM